MKKRGISKVISLVLILTCLFCSTAYAEEESTLLPDGQTVSLSIDAVEPRGFLIASRIVGITNNEDGTLRAYGHLVAHTTLDYALIAMYLDRYNPDIDDWVNLSYKTVEFNLGEGDCDEVFMSSPSVSYTLSGEGIEPGYYYRVRGTFVAKKEGRRESGGAETDGVLLTDIK